MLSRSRVLGFLLVGLSLHFWKAEAATPIDNPAAGYGLAWTDGIRWDRVLSVADMPGATAQAKLTAAQEKLGTEGGVVFFPPGEYRFERTIAIRNGVVLRGAPPLGVADARKDGYALPTRFEFPRYAAKLEGEGTPIETAFKGITLADPATASNCGVVHLDIRHGHIDFSEGENHQSGRNRIVLGCILRNAAVADPSVPDLKLGQHAWQRFTHRHHAAVGVRGTENLLVAGNRLPPSGEANFLQKGYVLQGRGKGEKFVPEEGVLFDYDNRPGLYVNDFGLGGAGGNPPDGTPETHPFGFRKGIVIRDNYVFCTGRCAISFTGDGTICSGNVIRFKPGVVRWTTTGKVRVAGSGTNDNRAVQMRGWRWTVEGNDYEVYRNRVGGSNYLINDGEGLMHEDHVNSTVRDSKLIDNRGNTYISIYKTAGIDGLLIRGNEIRTQGGIDAIYVVADRNSGRFPCRNVSIENNVTAGSGIRISGFPAANNVIRGNRHEGAGGRILNDAEAQVADNVNYRPETGNGGQKR